MPPAVPGGGGRTRVRKARDCRQHARRDTGHRWERLSFASRVPPGRPAPAPRAAGDAARDSPPMTTPLRLCDLPDGGCATVERVAEHGGLLDAAALHRLGELGFVPGESVQVLRRGPGGREPLAVLVGGTSLFALRLPEARCVEVVPA